MSKSSVREAFVQSVTARPVSLNDEPRVDRAEAPRRRASRRPVDVLAASTRSSWRRSTGRSRAPSARAPAARGPAAAARRSAPPSGGPATRSRGGAARPVAGPSTTTVSRWFVIPIARRSAGSRRPRRAPRCATARETSQISSASCSTQPGRGKCCANSRYARPTEPRGLVEDEAGGAGRALVDGEDQRRREVTRRRACSQCWREPEAQARDWRGARALGYSLASASRARST